MLPNLCLQQTPLGLDFSRRSWLMDFLPVFLGAPTEQFAWQAQQTAESALENRDLGLGFPATESLPVI